MTELKTDPNKAQSKDGVATLIGGRHGMTAMKRALLGLVLAGAVMLPHHGAASGAGGGAASLNVQFYTDMVNTGVDPDASGRILGTLVRSGRSSNQQLKLSLAHLDPNTAYQLIAFIGDETTPRPVTDFTTDQNGAFAITYVAKLPENLRSRRTPGRRGRLRRGPRQRQRQGQAARATAMDNSDKAQAPSSSSTDSTAPECAGPYQPHPSTGYRQSRHRRAGRSHRN